MLQEPALSGQRSSAAEKTLEAHVDRWRRAYDAALQRLTSGREKPGAHALTDFAWDRGVLDLVSPLAFEARDELRRAGTGLPWGDRCGVELFLRIMYAACAEESASADPYASNRAAARNPIRLAVAMTGALSGELLAPKDLLRGLKNLAVNQVRLRTGRSEPPSPFALHAHVMVGNVYAYVAGYGHDGTVIIDRETRPNDPQELEWTLHPRGRWQARALPWLVDLARF